MPEITRKSMILKSRTQKPYFQYRQDIISYAIQSDALAKVLYFSVDPVMKVWLSGAPTNFRKTQPSEIFNCFGLAQIINGNQSYEKGTYLFGNVGTTNYVIIDDERSRQCFEVPEKLVKMFGEQNFLYIVNNGLAAYAGYQIMSPKQGDNVLVSTAGGATGLLLCQLLQKKQCKVIGLTSPSKLNFIKKYTNIACNYQNKEQLQKTLQQNNFKYYFDNVGEWLLDLVIDHIQKNGRIALCGATSNYETFNSRGINSAPKIIFKRLKLEGLTFFGKFPKIFQIFEQYQGIELHSSVIDMKQFPNKFVELLSSGNTIIGKIIVKVN